MWNLARVLNLDHKTNKVYDWQNGMQNAPLFEIKSPDSEKQ